MTEKRVMMTSTLHETARFIKMQYVFYNVELSHLNHSMWLALISGVSGFDLLLTNTYGVVEACSGRDFLHLGLVVPEHILHAAVTGGSTVRLSNLNQIYGEARHMVGMPLIVDVHGEELTIGFLFVSSDMAAFRQEWQNFSGVFTLITLGVMILTFTISFFATKKQSEPLKEMAGAARRFARGDFSIRVEDSGRQDELGQLTRAFNAMADSLEGSEMIRREFIANLSHELKTPMTVISGYAEGLLDGTIPHDNEDRYLNVVSSETKRLSRLVNSMLEVSTLHSAGSETLLDDSFDASEVVRLALLSLDSKIYSKNLDVEAELPEEAIMTRGDRDAITQVVFNLIDNAIKFSDQGGKIGLSLWKQGNRAFVSIENRGETIPEGDLPHIFERFHKADKSRSASTEGVGLGLYIVKTILDNHNEDIFVNSTNGFTKFVFTLTIV